MTNMYQMFRGNIGFNGDIGWDTSQVTNMGLMFYYSYAFNGDIEAGTHRVRTRIGCFTLRKYSTNPSSWDTPREHVPNVYVCV